MYESSYHIQHEGKLRAVRMSELFPGAAQHVLGEVPNLERAAGAVHSRSRLL